jgi:hypothetical protein
MSNYGRSKRRGPHHIFPRYTRKDLAEAIGVSVWSLNIYVKEHGIRLDWLTLSELNDLINELKEKRPLNHNVPRSKPKVADDTF